MTCLCTNCDFVDIIGLCDLGSINLALHNYWTQISIPETLLVPEEKPEIEQINSVAVGVEIFKQKVIKTPISSNPTINWEGKIETGRKLIIEGGVCQTITYTGALPQQSVHTVHFVVPFSAFIVLPLEIYDTDPLDLGFQINACIEDVFIKEFSGRQIFKNVTLLLQAVPVPRAACAEDC